MTTFYLGLSMAGTVSAGTYTAGSLIELNTWLSKWRAAVNNNKPVTLTAQFDFGKYKMGDKILLEANEIPKHEVKIKNLTGASGGGVSAALYLIGLATGNVEILKETWEGFSIDKMLNNADIEREDAKIYSVLNVMPIEDIVKKLEKIKWDDENRLKEIDYIEDIVELYQTLASYEAIPYKIYGTNKTDESGIFNTHFDYIRFGFLKHHALPDDDADRPYRYKLEVKTGDLLKLNNNWKKLIESTPATGAFPIGFRPRSVRRYKKEYEGQLFYLNYSMPGSGVDYSQKEPNWIPLHSNDLIDMEYFDGGTFNREPHDLSRASLIRYFQLKKIKLPKNKCGDEVLPNDGEKTFASVILIDPFPSTEAKKEPGKEIKGLPELMKQPALLLNALMHQGRFHTDWMEKTLDDLYYSRFLISPSRPVVGKCDDEEFKLAGAPFSAFGGFFDESFRNHDYKLGHYNTYKFLRDSFTVPTHNMVVDYCQNLSADTMEKYKALGWLSEDGKECEIIPRFEEPNNLNSQLPEWPKIDRNRWSKIEGMMMDRGYILFRNLFELWGPVEWGIWKIFLKSKMKKLLEEMEKTLKCAKLLK